MTRRHFAVCCEGSQLAVTLDEAPAGTTTGLLLVTGGNETRAGAWAGQAQFAARIAAAGYPVLRFDRRGCGDSEGENHGFRASGPDIAAALATFRRECPHLTRVVGMGNCDAASALILAKAVGCDALILLNPWTFESATPSSATLHHYRRRLTNTAALGDLLKGKVALRPLLKSLVSVASGAAPQTSLMEEMGQAMAAFTGSVRFLIGTADRTGQAFLAQWGKADPRVRLCACATHNYVEPHARDWLFDQVLEVLDA